MYVFREVKCVTLDLENKVPDCSNPLYGIESKARYGHVKLLDSNTSLYSLVRDESSIPGILGTFKQN